MAEHSHNTEPPSDTTAATNPSAANVEDDSDPDFDDLDGMVQGASYQ